MTDAPMASDADIARALQTLLAAGIPRPKDAPDDVALWIRAYRLALGNVTLEALDRAVGDYISSDAKFFPQAGYLAKLARSFMARREAWSRADAEPLDYFVVGKDHLGPYVRHLPVSEGRARNLPLPSAVACLDRECGCGAVEVRAIAPAPRPAAERRRGGEPVSLRASLPIGAQRWVWEHVALTLTDYEIVHPSTPEV